MRVLQHIVPGDWPRKNRSSSESQVFSRVRRCPDFLGTGAKRRQL